MTLKEDLIALAELDRRVIRAFIESDGLDTAVGEYLLLRKKIRVDLLGKTAVEIDATDAAVTLRKITTGKGLPADQLIEQLCGEPLDELDDDEINQLGSDHFYSWFSHAEYIAGLSELRPLVLREQAGESVSRLMLQVKACYAFQQYDAAYSLCRTVIEASIRDICVRRQLFPDLGDNVILFDKFRWSQLKEKVSRGALREQLGSLYYELSLVLHGRKSVSKAEACTAIESTLQTVEQLYLENGL